MEELLKQYLEWNRNEEHRKAILAMTDEERKQALGSRLAFGTAGKFITRSQDSSDLTHYDF